MLPLEPWLAAMNIEATLPPRPPQPAQTLAGVTGLRRYVGRTLIALGVALSGAEQGRPAGAAR